MNDDQFDKLLAWTMLAANNGAIIEQQNILKRDLTEEEYQDCYAKTYRNAVMIQGQLKKSRE